MFMTVPHPRKYGLKLLLCTFMALPYTTYELEVEQFKIIIKIEQIVDNKSHFLFDA